MLRNEAKAAHPSFVSCSSRAILKGHASDQIPGMRISKESSTQFGRFDSCTCEKDKSEAPASFERGRRFASGERVMLSNDNYGVTCRLL